MDSIYNSTLGRYVGRWSLCKYSLQNVKRGNINIFNIYIIFKVFRKKNDIKRFGNNTKTKKKGIEFESEIKLSFCSLETKKNNIHMFRSQNTFKLRRHIRQN